MAIVNLATFEIDSSKAQKEMDSLRERIVKLSNEQTNLRNKGKELQKSLAELGERTTENASAYDDLVEAQKENLAQQQKLLNENKKVKSEYDSLNKVLLTRLDIDGKTVSMGKLIENTLSREVKSINEAREGISEMIKLRNQLNPEIEEQAELINTLNEQIDSNTEYIRSNTSAMEQQKMNIGNYQESMQNALGELSLFNGGLTGFVQKSQESGGAGKALMGAFSGVTTGIMGMTKATLAFIATPIGAILAAIVAVLLLVKNAMNQNAEATQKITSIFNVFGSVVKQIFKVVEPFGTWLIDGLAKGFEVAGELAEKAMRGLAAAMEFLGMEEAAKSVNSFTDNVKESAKAAYELAQAELEMEKAQREAQKTMLTYQNEAEKLRQIRDDDMKSMPERIAANDALGVSLQKQMQVEKQLAQTALNVAQLRIKANGETKESLDALAEAQTNLIDIEERITGQMSEQLTNRNALLKEQAEKAEEIRRKAYENDLKRMQDELKLFQEQQGFKSKTLEEEFKVFEETSNRETDILKLQLKNRAISQTEFNAEMQRLQNEQGLKLAEIAIENAEIELKAYKELNNDKYLENKRLNDDLFAQENKRRSDILAADQAFAELQLEQGIINKTEYDAQMLELETQFQENKRQLENDYEATKREEEQLQRELDLELRLLALADDQWASYEAEKINNDVIYEQRKIDLDNQRQQGLISEENYLKSLENARLASAEADKQLAKAVQEYKLDVASQTFGNMATLLGKETAAGKAAAIAQTTIETYKSATSAYSSMSGIPVVGPVLGAIAAAAAVASGLKTVKEITSVKTPSSGPIQGLATGGIVADGFEIQRANGDDRLVTLQTDEAVLSRRSRAFMGDSMLAAAGVPMSGAASSTVGSSSPMMEEIALAVEQGAMRGSEQGSRSGSTEGIRRTAEDRLVQQSATF